MSLCIVFSNWMLQIISLKLLRFWMYKSTMILHYFMQLVSADGTQEIGKITKQWSGLAKEFLTSADNFGVQCKFTMNIHFD